MSDRDNLLHFPLYGDTRKSKNQYRTFQARPFAGEVDPRIRAFRSAAVAKPPGFIHGSNLSGLRRVDTLLPHALYVLLGDNGMLYAGSTMNLVHRLEVHRRIRRNGWRLFYSSHLTYTFRQPWHLLHESWHASKNAALMREIPLHGSTIEGRRLLDAHEADARRLHATTGCAVPWLGLAGFSFPFTLEP